MNKHTKLVVGVLIVVLILLVIAIISFSMDISKNTDAKNTPPAEDAINPDGSQIVRGENGLYGVSDSNGNVLIEPEWEQLRFVGTDHLAATENHRVGVLDMDGNVTAPFVYSEVYALTGSYYLAEFADSGKAIIYDSKFHAFDAAAWDSCEWAEEQLLLKRGENSFFYTTEGENTLLLEQANLSCDGCAVVWNDKADVTALSPLEWSYAADTVEQLLKMIKSQDFSSLSSVTDTSHENNVLSGATLKDGKVLRNDATIFLALQEEENGSMKQIWQIGMTISGKDSARSDCTLTITLGENQQGIWMATDVQIS